MIDDSNIQIAGYLVVACASIIAFIRERRADDGDRPDIWQPFWPLTALVLVLMSLGHVGELGELLASYGRSEAAQQGWYADRRRWQAIAVGLVCSMWVVVVVASVWRFPERRRRYRPMMLVTFSLICFAAVRMLSLHHIDALLYRSEFAGLPWGVVVELGLLAVAGATTLWQPMRPEPTARRRARAETWA